MSQEEQECLTAQLDQIIITVFTCRSLIKYNVSLSEEQRTELLAEIDGALEILRTHALMQEDGMRKKTETLSFVTDATANIAEATQDVNGGTESCPEQQTLQALYQMYHTYIDEKQGAGIQRFVATFNEVMALLGSIEQLLARHTTADQGYTQQKVPNALIQQVSTYVADIYYIFMEFLRTLSNALQNCTAYFDTEELSSFSV
ncbi:MAG TPA: hypothetical protein VL461_12960 [Dictyobacter sp.]|jgi:hypothetical protein|nr:hypothetical protein [Dictyobacter sp.]